MTTPLNDLVRRLALLAAPRTYSLTARLLGGRDGSRVELRAASNSAGEVREYIRHVTLSALEREGAGTVAKGFAREAAEALAGDTGARQVRHRRFANRN